MAQQLIHHLVDDLDQTGETKADETVTFHLDGVDYEIDLSAANATRLRDTLGTYVTHGRRTGGRIKRGTTRPAGMKGSGTKTYRSDAGQIREWANANGYGLSNRGRIPADVVNAYEATHAKPAAVAKPARKKTPAKASTRTAAPPAFTTPGAKPARKKQ